MTDLPDIRIGDYNYELPPERIAKYPLEDRDASKLLFYTKGNISERQFLGIPELLPPETLLVFNETKVIRARLRFRKDSGALIEIFCLEPVQPSQDFQLAFRQQSPVVWKCMVGNAKRWKKGMLNLVLEDTNENCLLKAEIVKKLSDAFLIRFEWEPGHRSFAEIIEQAGLVPLPPYLNREAEDADKTRYQTVYARNEGSVAAPTAGLHFTDRQFQQLRENNIDSAKVTLHVGAGTFRPVIADAVSEHQMHAEKMVVSKSFLEKLLTHLPSPVIPVGTTSMRTLESLYWLAKKINSGDETLFVDQWDPYQVENENGFEIKKALEVLIKYMSRNRMEEIKAETRLMIAPGYNFKLCNGLITNFHLPKSTLLLLVAALIGDDWKKAYSFALNHNFRFLSYGDSCLFLP